MIFYLCGYLFTLSLLLTGKKNEQVSEFKEAIVFLIICVLWPFVLGVHVNELLKR